MMKPVAQIFVSYAHLDNARPQGFQMGWVDRLYDALSIEVPTHGVTVQLWRDRRDLEPESYFDETILSAVSRSDIFLAILSPAYPQRAFCLKELTHFLTPLEPTAPNDRGRRVLKVVKRPIADQEVSAILPVEIRGTGEFRFYSEDRQTRNVLLFIRPNGDIASEEFWDAREQLAEAIVRTVKQVELQSPDVAVYLAEPKQIPFG
jgi:hypothetical protein